MSLRDLCVEGLVLSLLCFGEVEPLGIGPHWKEDRLWDMPLRGYQTGAPSSLSSAASHVLLLCALCVTTGPKQVTRD